MPDLHLPAESTVSRNPATGELIRTYAFQTPDGVERMLREHAAAVKLWRTTAMTSRVNCYRRLASTLRDRRESLALLATSEMGKIIGEARAEIEKCASAVEWFAEHGPAILVDEPAHLGGGGRAHVSFLPIGTILGVMPWNFPFWQVMRAAGPIMLSGNGFALKHASNVMGCAYALQDVYEASGFPPHLLTNLCVSTDAVAKVIQDPRIAAVTVTGSMRAGSAVASVAGMVLKKSLLELGGADAFIVLADADLDKAVEAGIKARFQNAGQVCLAAKRFILERPIAGLLPKSILPPPPSWRRGTRSTRRHQSGRSRAMIFAMASTTKSSAPLRRAPSCCSAVRRSTVRACCMNRPCSATSRRVWQRSTRRCSGR